MFDKSSSSHSLVLHFIYQKWHVKICNQVVMSYILEAYNLIQRWACWKKWRHHWMIGWFNHFGVVYDRWDSFSSSRMKGILMSQGKKNNNSYFPLNPRCLRTGSLFHGLWNNPHITEVSSTIYTKQPGALVSLHKLWFEAPQENTMRFKDRSSLSSNSSLQALTSSYGKKKWHVVYMSQTKLIHNI